MNSYVIIGNGIAATGCIEGIRSKDPDGKITIVSEENHPAYCRPLISYYLEGKTDTERILYRSPDFYERMNCSVLYGKRAVSLDTEKKMVKLDDGAELPYTKLCIATGSDPFQPPFEGLDTVDNKFSFMKLDDALSLEAAINSDSRVLIIGAGLIGLKCAEGIRDRVKSITVCDLSQRILSSIFDDECAAFMQKHLENNGIQFMLGDSAARFNGKTAFMKSGKTVDFDVLVLTVGVRPNISLIKDAGGKTNRGIVCSESMQTSIPDIYAAGDCTEIFDVASDQYKVLATLPNASMEGFIAGANMAGGNETFDKGTAMNSLGFFGLSAMTAGSYEGDVYEEKTEQSVKKLFIKDDLLKGFMLIGCSERAGIYTSLIRERTPLSSINFELLKKAATTAAFPEEVRRKKFGGVV